MTRLIRVVAVGHGHPLPAATDMEKSIMHKIVVAFDSLHFSESALQYAIYLGRQRKTNLVGVFLDNPPIIAFLHC